MHINSSALANLGVSINVMPYKILLGLGEPTSTKMMIQLVERSICHTNGVVEDMLVKMDRFIFLVDFVICDVDEDVEIPLILGSPFLATSKALIYE